MLVVVVGVSSLLTAAAQVPVPTAGSICALTASDAKWIQTALDGWAQTSREFLKIDDAPLPWMVFFDDTCAWHVGANPRFLARATPVPSPLTFAERPLEVRALSHAGTVWLPSGIEVSVRPKASTSVYRGGQSTFLVMALPRVWAADRHYAKRPRSDQYFLGVMSHELTHSRLLVQIQARLNELGRGYRLPEHLNDDVVQFTFERIGAFKRAFEIERDLFFQGAMEKDVEKRRTLLTSALALAAKRRAQYFTGPNKFFADLEELFLTLEGTGQWAAYRVAREHGAPGQTEAETLDLVRDDKKWWSQEEGLAIFLALDAVLPDWPSRIFTASPASPFALLAEGIK